MSKNTTQRHEELRKKLWVKAWAHVANHPLCMDNNVATSWADKALIEFDKRFTEPKNTAIEK